jgi:hypothetical protein
MTSLRQVLIASPLPSWLGSPRISLSINMWTRLKVPLKVLVRVILSFVYWEINPYSTSESLSSLVASGGSFDQDDITSQTLALLTGCLANYRDLQGLLSRSTLQKGLANYNSDVPLETLLREIVDAHKYTLKEVTIIIGKLPVVGPVVAEGKPLT